MAIENLEVIYSFFISIALGALIGVEREKSHQDHKGTDFAGIRTFMLISLLGSLSAYLSQIFYPWILGIAFVCFVVVILSGYILSSFFNKDIGMTTGLSTIIAFILGILVFIGPEDISILIAIAVTLILSFKNTIHKFVYTLKTNEFFDTMKFLVIAFVILPLLKNIEPFGPYDSIYLYEIWLMVVFVSAVSYLGYILIKVFGANRGSILTGILGGILSSTAVVSSLASKSKEDSNANASPMVLAGAIACSTMFIRVLIEVAILNFNMIEKLAFPMVLLSLAGYVGVSIFWKNEKKHLNSDLEFSSPLMLGPALKFGLFYAFVLMMSNISQANLGPTGVIIAALITGMGDADAIAIFVARHPEIGAIGISAVVLAAVTNTITKMIIAKAFGSKEFGAKFMKMLLPTIVTGLIILAFFIPLG